MIDRDQGFARRHRKRLPADQANHDPADQAWPGGCGNGVNRVKVDPGIGKHRFHHWRHPLGMSARGDFRYDPAIRRVFGLLTGDPFGNDCTIRANQRYRGFVAA
jgi:hypothetical protein